MGRAKRRDTLCSLAFTPLGKGVPGCSLEDLLLRQTFRGKGIGKALLANVAGIAKRENCYGVRWEVLDWNQTGDRLLQEAGATFLDQWKSVLLTGDALEARGRSELTPTSQTKSKDADFSHKLFRDER